MEKKKQEETNLCPNCGRKHDNFKFIRLGIFCTTEEKMEYELIQNRVGVAQTAAKPESMSKDVAPEVMKNYFAGALIALADAQSFEREWWRKLMRNHDIEQPKRITIDFRNGEIIEKILIKCEEIKEDK